MIIWFIYDVVAVLTVNVAMFSVFLRLHFVQVYNETEAVGTDESRFAGRKPKTRVVWVSDYLSCYTTRAMWTTSWGNWTVFAALPNWLATWRFKALVFLADIYSYIVSISLNYDVFLHPTAQLHIQPLNAACQQECG
jgi:hypothetical protein